VEVYSEALRFKIIYRKLPFDRKVKGERKFEMEIRTRIIGISFIVGMITGVVVGRITDNMGLWVAMGSVIGIMIGAVITTVGTNKNDEK